jgi:hypothetical protein
LLRILSIVLVPLQIAAWSAAAEETTNLVVNGDFELPNGPPPKPGEKVHKFLGPKGWERPDGVKVDWDKRYGTDGTFGIRTQMNRHVAEGYGQGYFSDPIPIRERETYTISVDVKSDAPNAIVFVKGFTRVKGEEREAFSHHKEAHFDRYLKLNEWTNLTFAFRPRHTTYSIDHIKVWLYGYLKPGTLYFDNVMITKGGKLTPNPVPQPPKPTKTPIFIPPDPDGNSSPPVYLDPNKVGKE